MLNVRLIAPSSRAANIKVANKACLRLHQLGCALSGKEVLMRKYLCFAGTAAQRAADINQFADFSKTLPDIALAMRGGYGAIHVLSLLDYRGLQKRFRDIPIENQLILSGHSDFTAVQLALLAQVNWVTFSGPMLIPDFGAQETSSAMQQHFFGIIHQSSYSLKWKLDSSLVPLPKDFTVSGRLWGGNLATIVSLLGTPYFPKIEGGILFVEDIGEHALRIDRLLYQLVHAGVLARQKALILGNFSSDSYEDLQMNCQLAPLLHAMHAFIKIPIISGLPIGHIADKVTLPVGADAQLKVQGAQAILAISKFPYLNSRYPHQESTRLVPIRDKI